MSQLNAKEALVKKASANKSTTDVLNQRRVVAPRMLSRLSMQMKDKNSQNSSLDASEFISKVPTKPKSTNTSLHASESIPKNPNKPKSTNSSLDASESISKLPTKPQSASTTKSTSNSLVKSPTSLSMPQPTSTPTISTTLSMPQPTSTPTISTTPTTNNTETMPEARTTTPPNSSHVNTSTTTPDDHVEESDAVETVSTRPDGRIAVIVYNKM